MLTRFHKILGAVLAVQILLAIIVHMRGDDRAIAQEQPMLVGFDAAKVTRLQIINDSKTLDLTKKGSAWVIANGFDYPISSAKIDEALAPLAKLTAGTPIATQKVRHKQLSVDDHEFGSKVTLTADGKDITLLIGTSVGGRRVAVRRGGDDAVYAVSNVSQSTFSGYASRWVDDKYLALGNAQVESIKVERPGGGPGSVIEVAKQMGAIDGTPTYTASVDGAALAPPAGQRIAPSPIDTAFNTVTGLTLDEPGDPTRDANAPTATVTITLASKDAGQPAPPPVVLDMIVDGTKVWAHQRGLGHAIIVDKARVDALLTLAKDKLLEDAPAAAAPAPTGQGDGLPPGVTQQMIEEAMQKQGITPPQ